MSKETEIEIEIELDLETIGILALEAHRKNLTLNTFIVDILTAYTIEQQKKIG